MKTQPRAASPKDSAYACRNPSPLVSARGRTVQPEFLQAALRGLLEQIDALTRQVAAYDQ
jgi:hypothetical protein